MNVPQVTELRRQLRAAKASYTVVKNTLAKRALKGTSFEPLEKFFEGTTAVAYTTNDPVALAKTLTTFVKTAPTLKIKAAVVQGRAVKPAEITELAALPSKPELLRAAARHDAGADGAARHGAERRPARFDECVGGRRRRRDRKHSRPEWLRAQGFEAHGGLKPAEPEARSLSR